MEAVSMEEVHKELINLLCNTKEQKQQKSDAQVTVNGIYETLSQLFIDSAHIIHPSLFSQQNSISSENDVGILRQLFFISEKVQIDNGTLKKPIIAIWKTHSIKSKKAKQSIHWQTCVIIPQKYKCFNGKQVSNQNEKVFLIGCQNELQTPLFLTHLLKSQVIYPYQGQKNLVGGIFFNLQVEHFHQKSCNQGRVGKSCGFSSVFNAIMFVLEGQSTFLKNKNRIVGKQLLRLFPRLSKKSPTIFKKNESLQNTNQNKEIKLLSYPSTFQQLIQTDYFVDKSLLIRQFFQGSGSSVILTRPRHWGKTLNINMLKTFLQIEVNQNGQKKQIRDKINIFNGGYYNGKFYKRLKIAQHKKIMKEAGEWPVVFLNFSSLSKVGQKQSLVEDIRTCISEAFRSHQYLLSKFHRIINSPDAKSYHKNKAERAIKKFNKFLNRQEEDLSDSLYVLIDLLFKHFDKRVIVLVDQYDAVFNREIKNKSDISTIRQMYLIGLKVNEKVQKIIMAGLFTMPPTAEDSGINLWQQTVLEYSYAQYFGFTQVQVDQLMNSLLNHQSQEQKQLIKQFYNGYKIGRETIFNPWSIIHCLQAHRQNYKNPLKDYWINAENEQKLHTLFRSLKDNYLFDQLMSTGSVFLKIGYYMFQHDQLSDKLFFMLVHLGYLTRGQSQSQLKIPNTQIREGFYQKTILKIWIQDFVENKTSLSMNEFLQSVLQTFQDCEQYEKLINNEILINIQYWEKCEKFFHGLLSGTLLYISLTTNLSKHVPFSYQYYVRSNVMDSIFLPIQGKSETVILQKQVNNKNSHDFNKAVEEGLRQAQKHLEFVLNPHNRSLDWKFLKIRIIVFSTSYALKKWSAKIKQFRYTFIHAQKLYRILLKTLFKNSITKAHLINQTGLTTIYQLFNSQSINQNQSIKAQQKDQNLQNENLLFPKKSIFTLEHQKSKGTDSMKKKSEKVNKIQDKRKQFHKMLALKDRSRIIQEIRNQILNSYSENN